MLHVVCCVTFYMPFEIARLFFLLIFGLAVGSFINAFTWRLHEGMSLARGRSMCPSCRTPIQARDLVPLFSYLMLGGRCRTCKVVISPQYPIVELFCAILYILVGIFVGGVHGIVSPQVLLALFFIAALLALFVYDLRWYILPDIITVPAIVVGFLGSGFLFSPSPCFPDSAWCFLANPWFNLLFAAAIGAGFFFLQFAVSHGAWVGGGDIRLGGLMGVILGFPGILIALFLAYMMGSIVGIGLMAGKKAGMKSQVPFGPFLTLATVIVMLFGKDILAFVSALGFL